MAKISVIGSGGWGIALTILLHKNGHDLTIWSFDKKEAEELKKTRQNKTKLPPLDAFPAQNFPPADYIALGVNHQK